MSYNEVSQRCADPRGPRCVEPSRAIQADGGNQRWRRSFFLALMMIAHDHNLYTCLSSCLGTILVSALPALVPPSRSSTMYFTKEPRLFVINLLRTSLSKPPF